jgi:hypothetical protein
LARAPAFTRELAELRQYGNRRPPGNVVLITDDWGIARVHRRLGGFALVVDVVERPSISWIHDLLVLLVMDRPWPDLLLAVRRGNPRSCARVSQETWLSEVERLVGTWDRPLAA